MSRIDRLTQWQSGATSLRLLTRGSHGAWNGAADALSEGDVPESTCEIDMALGAACDVLPNAATQGRDLEAEVGTTLIWGDDESDEPPRPMESLPVYRMAGTWRDSDGCLRATIHGMASEAAYASGECVLGQSSLWQESAALALLSLPDGEPDSPGIERQRRAVHDVRPHLLLLLHAEDSRALTPCLRYGANYLTAWSARNANPASPAAIKAAAHDGLALLFRCRRPRGCDRVRVLSSEGDFTAMPADFRRAYADEIRAGYEAFAYGEPCPYTEGTDDFTAWRYGWDWADRRDSLPAWQLHPIGRPEARKLAIPSTKARARELGMRDEDFARLRHIAVETYRMRLAEAEARFLSCANYTAPKTSASESSGLRAETWWHPERVTRNRRSDRYPGITKLDNRNERRPPARRPRAPTA